MMKERAVKQNRGVLLVVLMLLALLAVACGSEPPVDEAATAVPEQVEAETDTVTEEQAIAEAEAELVEDTAALTQEEVETLLIGTWTGLLEVQAGTKYLSEWQFLPDGKLVVVARIIDQPVTFQFDYYFDPDGALRLSDGSEGEPGRREIEFVDENTVLLTAVRDGLVTRLRRTVLTPDEQSS